MREKKKPVKDQNKNANILLKYFFVFIICAEMIRKQNCSCF